MKKSIMILTAFMCLLVGCGDKTSSDNNTESSAETATEETTFATEVITNVSEKISDKENGYNEVIDNYMKCIEKNEIGNMMQLSYPDKYFDIFSFMAEMSGTTVGEIMGIVQGTASNTLRITEIISDEPLEDYETLTNTLVSIYGEYQIISNYIDEQGGKDSIDADEFDEFVENADYDLTDISLYFEPEDAHLLTCNMESSVQSEDESLDPQIVEYEQKFIVYYIDGEGWKMDTYVPVTE